MAEFDVHTITVTRVSYEEPHGNNLTELPLCEYTIDHGACEQRGEECLVEEHVNELGLHAAMFGVWDTWSQNNRLQAGATYRVRGWTSKYDVPGEPIEYDAGIEEVEDEDEAEKSINDLVEEWHRLYADKPPEQVLPLHEYLGMSRDQYHQWVLDPDSLNNDATTNDDNDEQTKETGHGSD